MNQDEPDKLGDFISWGDPVEVEDLRRCIVCSAAVEKGHPMRKHLEWHTKGPGPIHEHFEKPKRRGW